MSRVLASHEPISRLTPEGRRRSGAISATGAIGLATALGPLAPFPASASAALAQPALELSAPRLVASGAAIPLRGRGAQPRERVHIEIRSRNRWRRLASARADRRGRFERGVRPRRIRGRYVLRARTAGEALSARAVVRSRDVLLAAVGDVNLGDGPADVMARRGLRHPWSGTAHVLRAADIAFGNLECAVSVRGAPVPKQFTFRGGPPALRTMARYAGFDVLNLANNHVGDYGRSALLDTVRHTRRFGMKAVGAGGSLESAAQPRTVERLGLTVAFVGFSNILPSSFFAGAHRAGTQPAFPALIDAGVRRAARRADVVIATFHWGTERAPREDARQRDLAQVALRAGAHAVIGAHPHVLQPTRTVGRRRLVAYSLGNFVFAAASPQTTRTGILRLRLSARGVEGHRLAPAFIEETRPRLLR